MLTRESIFQKYPNVTSLSKIKMINMWGSDIEDISIMSEIPNIEILSLSVNKISNLSPLSGCLFLKELYLRRNEISSLLEINHLCPLKNLRILWLGENPIAELSNYRSFVVSKLPQLAKLDNVPTNNNSQLNKTLLQPQSTEAEPHGGLRRAISSIDAARIKKEDHGDDSISINKIEQMNSFLEINQYFKQRKRSLSNKKIDNSGYKKVNLKLKIKNEKNPLKIPLCRRKHPSEVKKVNYSTNTSHIHINSTKFPDSKEEDNDYILTAIWILVDKMKKDDLVFLSNELKKKIAKEK